MQSQGRLTKCGITFCKSLLLCVGPLKISQLVQKINTRDPSVVGTQTFQVPPPVEVAEPPSRTVPEPIDPETITRPVAPLPATQGLQLASRPKQKQPALNHKFQEFFVNHYPLTISASAVFQYQVTITPEVEQKGMRHRLLQMNSNVLGTQYLYDGEKLLFTTEPLVDQTLLLKDRDGHEVTIQNTKQYEPTEVPKQVYALLIRKVLRQLDLVAMGRQHYQPKTPIQMPSKYRMVLWPGFFLTVHDTMKGATLCADLAHKVVRTDTVLDLMYDMWKKFGDTKKTDQRISELLEGQIVLTRYNNRTYRIDEVDFLGDIRTTFNRNGSQCTLLHYYQDILGLRIEDQKQPLLVHLDRRSGEETLLLPELCLLTGLTDEMRNDDIFMKDLATHTRVNPTTRSQKLDAFSRSINKSDHVKEALSEWNVTSSAEQVKVTARIIPPQLILMGRTTTDRPQWNTTSLIKTVEVRKCVFVYPSDVSEGARDLLNHIRNQSRALGIVFDKPLEVKIQQDDPDQFEEAIRLSVTKDTMLVLCMLKKKGDVS